MGATVGDQVPAIFAALGVLAALRQREHEGRGQKVDVAMLDSLLGLLWDEPLDHYANTGVPERFGNDDPRGSPFGVFETRDGWVSLVVTSQDQWQRLAERMGNPALATRYPDLGARVKARDAVNGAVANWCRSRSTADAVDALVSIGVPAGPLRSAGAASDDPQVRHRGALVPLRHPDAPEGATPFRGPAFPVRFSRASTETAPAEPLGASTESVLRDVLDLDDDAIDALRREGVLG